MNIKIYNEFHGIVGLISVEFLYQGMSHVCTSKIVQHISLLQQYFLE